MTSVPPPTPWGPPPGPSPDSLRRRSALALWALGGVQVVIYGCCSFVAALVGGTPLVELQKHLPPGETLPPGSDMAHPYMVPLAVLGLLLGFFPGLAYIVLGFPVRAGLRAPTLGAAVLTLVQAAAQSVGLVLVVAGAAMTGDPVALGLGLLGGGAMLGAQGVLAYWLIRLLRAPAIDEALETDPWNEPEA